MKQPLRTTKLRLELLEGRQLLAGDLDVFAIGNVLHVRGDDADNGVAIFSTSEGVFEVRGLSQGGAATTVNGLAGQPFIRIKEIILTLGDGNDALVMTGMPLSGSVSIQMNDGDDFIGLGEFNNNSLVDPTVNGFLDALAINTNIVIDSGDGNDTVVGRNVSAKAIAIATYAGNDSITFDNQGNSGDPNYIPGLTATKGLAINAGEGENSVTLKGLNVSSLTVNLGAAEDHVTVEKSAITKGVNIQAKDGPNVIDFDEVTAKSLLVTAGVGNDTVTLDDVTCTKRISLTDSYGNDVYELNGINARSLGISAGFGNDEISLDDVTTTRSIGIDPGGGNDTVDLKNVIAQALVVVRSEGDDTVTLENVAVSKKLVTAGGLGNDTISLKLVSADALEALLANGDDEITLETVLINQKAKIDGGKDNNTFNDVGGSTFGELTRTNFPGDPVSRRPQMKRARKS